MTPTQLKAARKRLGLSQTTLADELGISRSGVQKMELGQRPIERRTVLAVMYLENLNRQREEQNGEAEVPGEW